MYHRHKLYVVKVTDWAGKLFLNKNNDHLVKLSEKEKR